MTAEGRAASATRRDARRVLVLDDDPTGTQTSSAVRAILRPGDEEALDRFFASSDRAAFVITNTRALPRDEAAALVRTVVDQARACASRAGEDVAVVLRGDSTLRGHVFAETDAVDPDAAVLFVPAFPEGGRTTVDGIHLLEVDGVPVPVGQTEFARDHAFGYRSSRLSDWVGEVAPGRRARPVALELLRRDGPGAVADVLLDAVRGDVVVPDAATVADVRRIVDGLLDAERRGARVVVRGAATLAAARAGLSANPVDHVPVPGKGRVLVVCGSWTAATTAQLTALGNLFDARVEVSYVMSENDLATAAAGIRQTLDSSRTALVSTPRSVSGADVAGQGARLMAALVEVAARCAPACDAVVAKGGITSARVARDSFGAAEAWVEGQLLPGVPLWTLPTAHGPLPYAVVPGNVGGPDTLAAVLAAFARPPFPSLDHEGSR